MAYEDKTLVCKECGNEFIFSARDQEFFAQQGYANEPKMCRDCRRKRKVERESRQTTIVCKQCGKTDTVNFKPHNPNDILCNECFEKSRSAVYAAKATAAPQAPEAEEAPEAESEASNTTD